tara:strand:+ start:918 stop:1349 length:432 start_codon:yes stop_codon:yes gene_type:complete
MIKYNLICKSCNKSFDSWFASSKEYEKLKKLKHINCYNCNSLQIEKSLMSPNVLNKTSDEQEKIKNKKFIEIKKTIKEYQKFIKNNFQYVGKNFAYEARSIHYKNKKKSKHGIYGNTTLEELKELKEEGIETEVVPWISEKDN